MDKVPHRINGVSALHLVGHEDERGTLTEIYRHYWCEEATLVQWNMVASHENSLRGIHAHFDHFDYLLVISGQMRLGFKDLRENSDTTGERAGACLK